MLRGIVFVLLCVVLLCGMAPAAPGPSLAMLKTRLGRYVDSYGEQASAIVGLERYHQHYETSGQKQAQERTTEAEFAILKTVTGWVGFRDVVGVDGSRIPDRQGRLERALGDNSNFAAARRLSEESARFNIGSVQRNFNVPTATLLFFNSDNLDRFKFQIADRGTNGWHLAFRENPPGGLIRQPNGRPVRLAGDLWVDPDTGVVHRTVLRLQGFQAQQATTGTSTATIDVTYEYVAPMQMWLPLRMAEFYAGSTSRAWDHLSGTADYRDYRRFETSARIK